MLKNLIKPAKLNPGDKIAAISLSWGGPGPLRWAQDFLRFNGYEVQGEYGTALTWAQDSYTKYGNKNGRDYVFNLKWRMDEETTLKRQMNQ